MDIEQIKDERRTSNKLKDERRTSNVSPSRRLLQTGGQHPILNEKQKQGQEISANKLSIHKYGIVIEFDKLKTPDR